MTDPTQPTHHTARFPAMSVTVRLTGCGVSEADVQRAARIGAALANIWEDAFSRFRPTSTLSRLNAANGSPVAVDPMVLDLLETSREAVFATGGRFDPSILDALEYAGYDRDFALVKEHGASSAGRIAPRRAGGMDAWQRVVLDRARGDVILPPGMRIDLGGIAKGAFVDLLAARFHWWPGGTVEAGGDLRVWGLAPDGQPWRVAIERPAAEERDGAADAPITHAVILDPAHAGGVATSGIDRRRWTANGASAHHLIDPATGRPLEGAALSATAFAATCTAAEVAAKTLLLTAAEGIPFAPALARGILLGPRGEIVADTGAAQAAVTLA